MPTGEAPLGSLVAPEPSERPDLWPCTVSRGPDGALTLGGRHLTQVLDDAPTPVFVLDEADLRGRAASWSAAMHEEFWPGYGMAGGQAFYAGKAFLTTRVAQWVLEEGMGIDTASRGELAVSLAALQAVDGEDATAHSTRLGLHGNGKTQAEIAVALIHRVGHLVLDSLEEVELAARAVRDLRASGLYSPDERGRVMVRLTTGVHAGGHEFIATAHEDQKFGLSVHAGTARQAIDAVIAAPELELTGLHSHIGSQIMDLTGFREAARVVLTLRHEVAAATGVLAQELDLGGGYAIAYTGADPVPPSPAQVARALAETVRELCTALGDPVPHVSIEPGRSVAGPSTVMLYTVTGLKRVALDAGASRLYVSVDGGMSDNIRPALYEAAYTALVANRHPDPAAGLTRARVVGKHCESGDIVVRDVDLPADLAVGDVLAVPAVGAYGRSMASNYNMFTRPGVAWVRDGRQGWVLRPETVEDLIALEGE
ncbi:MULTISPECIES: diaminopimelate decarboxylase [unclassified Actinomyces]|uniref:diaminopimelate decarboxylase n=3 Tax=Actinomyces TaxID=1654 RepID=UPI002017F8D7|nr:diaminopimelate decarboxylase [Actinomyces sp. 217892]MCL3778425.1 diaminopimelate decarboxylase [Actinomyces sp. AC-20-1]MCL3790740.1 diaminopimelate decarboxylase [Actinomyces sp. 187325]MCL3793096.1 diaminopimelate decarboxylase [Actinomyces sp. 186855]MCL3795135.1 diaminopimelate decarboxylase [Actinomyces sp. 217892]